jgi:hypothetical protein
VAPCSTFGVKPLPPSSTVSMPMCRRISAPCGVRIVSAWCVRARCVIVPSHGATSTPSSGSMPMPSPNMPSAKTGSGTWASGTTGPVNGASRTKSLGLSVEWFNRDSSARRIGFLAQ